MQGRKNRGYTLLEIMLVLVIASVIMLTTILGYRSYEGRSKGQRFGESVSLLSQNLYSFFRTGGADCSGDAYCGSYSGVGNFQDFMVKQGMFPPELLNSDKTTTRSPWGGTIGANTVALNGNADSGLALSFYGVPDRFCSSFVQSVQGVGAKVEVGGVTVKDRTAATNKPLDVSAMSAACQSGGNVVVTLDSPSAYSGGLGENGLGTGQSGSIPASASSSIFVGPGNVNVTSLAISAVNTGNHTQTAPTAMDASQGQTGSATAAKSGYQCSKNNTWTVGAPIPDSNIPGC